MLFVSTSTFANLTGYCFRTHVSLENAKNSLKAILHPSDTIFKRPSEHCLEVKGSFGRASLYETFLNRKFGIDRTYGSALESQESPIAPACNINVKRSSNDNKKSNSFSIGKKNNISQIEDSGSRVTNSQLLIDSGRIGSIRVDNYRVKIKCINIIRKFKLEIELEHAKGGISTSITVAPGQETDLGAIVDDLNNKTQSISISEGLSKSKSTGKVRSRYSLSVR